MRPTLFSALLIALLPLHAAASAAPAQVQHQAADNGTGSVPEADAGPRGHTDRFPEPRAGLRTGGQPTAQDLVRLQAQGVRTVIDLRGRDEDRGFDEAAEATRLGLAYVALPIAGKNDITPASADALQALLDEHGDGVLLHCASGNRVGALLALAAARAGVPAAEALAFGREAGLASLEPVVAAQLDDDAARASD
jgi:uncharacterized protein (TIGR01244 family)